MFWSLIQTLLLASFLVEIRKLLAHLSLSAPLLFNMHQKRIVYVLTNWCAMALVSALRIIVSYSFAYCLHYC